MSYSEDFEQWEETIKGIPVNEVKLPNESVDDFVASVESLAIDANKDREELAGAGLDVSLIDQLNPLAGALRYCQAQWMSVYRARQEARKQWQEQSPQAYKFRDTLLHHFSFAYRNDGDVQKKVKRIREGASQADMVQDLIELAVLGEKNPEPLTAINFEVAQLQEARTLSHTMSEMLAAANGTPDEGNETKVLRDKAYTLLSEKESTIREYGRYVFWKDEKKKERYFR